jgi:hypothetical protein
MNALDIKKMTTEEKLQTIEALWDSMIHDETEIKSPDWHTEVLRDRKSKMEYGEVQFISLADLKKR